MSHKAYISELQMAIVITSSLAALGLFIFPRDLIAGAGQHIYSALATATAVAVLPAMLLVRLGILFPGQTPFQYAVIILGRPLGLLAGAWLALFYTGVAAVALRQFGDVVNSIFLPRTPTEVTMFLVLLVAVFITWHGTETVVRFIGLVVPVVMGLIVLIFCYGFTRVTEVSAIVPLLSLDLPSTLSGASSIMYEFIGVEAVAMLLPFVRRPTRPYLYTLGALGVNLLVLVLILVASVGIFGIAPVLHLQYPGASVLRVLRLPGLLVERLGSFVALNWTMIGLECLCFRFWAVVTGGGQLLGISPAQGRYFLIPMALAAYFLARWPESPAQFEFLTHQVMAPLFLVTNIGAPLIMLMVARVRGLGERT